MHVFIAPDAGMFLMSATCQIPGEGPAVCFSRCRYWRQKVLLQSCVRSFASTSTGWDGKGPICCDLKTPAATRISPGYCTCSHSPLPGSKAPLAPVCIAHIPVMLVPVRARVGSTGLVLQLGRETTGVCLLLSSLSIHQSPPARIARIPELFQSGRRSALETYRCVKESQQLACSYTFVEGQ